MMTVHFQSAAAGAEVVFHDVDMDPIRPADGGRKGFLPVEIRAGTVLSRYLVGQRRRQMRGLDARFRVRTDGHVGTWFVSGIRPPRGGAGAVWRFTLRYATV